MSVPSVEVKERLGKPLSSSHETDYTLSLLSILRLQDFLELSVLLEDQAAKPAVKYEEGEERNSHNLWRKLGCGESGVKVSDI